MKRTPKKVLIIDDESGVVKVLKKKLNADGKEVICAHNGEIGFTKAIEKKPDLVLLDIMLPGVGGVDLARRLQTDTRTNNIPIIFITAYLGLESDRGDEEIEVDGKFYRAFAKPLHISKLLSAIRKTINRNEQMKRRQRT